MASRSAHGSITPAAVINKYLSVLTAKGISVGVIAKIGGYTYRSESDGDFFFFDIFSNWEEMLLQAFGNCTDTTGKSILDVFDQALKILKNYLVLNGVDSKDELESKFKKREEQKAEREKKYQQRSTRYSGGGNMVEAFVRTIVADIGQDFQRVNASKYDRFWDKDVEPHNWGLEIYAFTLATNRRFFVTDNNYIGLAPIKSQVGDEVCVLYGCSVPLVLRNSDNKVTLVGEAYAHGLIDGEAVSLKEEGILKETEWTIV